jgi:hypothetical protein
MLRPLDVERALGDDFSRVWPENWRTVSVVVHLPRFITEVIATEPSLPSELSLEARIEQFLIGLINRHQNRNW